MSITGARHIGLNVTDLDYAVSWYTSTLGVGFQEWPNGHVETTKNLSYDVMVANEGGGRLLAHPTTGQCLGLTPATVPGRFNPRNPGLDHLSFAVSDLQAQVARLAGSVEHGKPIHMDEVGLTINSVDDPDGIQLEYTAAPDAPVGAVHHLRLTVNDLKASTRFYETLGFQVAPLPEDAPLLAGGVLMAHPTGLFLGLRPALDAADFNLGRVGVNYLSFEVASEDALHSLAGELADIGCQGTAPSTITAAGIAGVRTTDPSGIPVGLVTQL